MSSRKLYRLTQLGFILILSIGFVISLGWWLSSDGIQTAVAAPAHQSSDPIDEAEEVNSNDEEASTLTLNNDNSTPRSGEKPFANAVATSLPPVVTDESYETDEDTSLLITATTGILANDTDPEGMTLTAVYAGDPLWGDLSLDSDGGFTYIPTTDFNGTDNFDYIVSDDTLIFYEGFEDTGDATYEDNIDPIPGAPNVAYGLQIAGESRMRTQVSTTFVRTGTHGATLDRDTNSAGNRTNYLTVTVDMSAYSVATDTIVLDFSWMDHGEEDNTPDRVWVRGSNSDGWLEIYDFTANRGTNGTNRDTTDLAVSQLLLDNGQEFSSTFQILFGQRDSAYANSTTSLDGMTFDDIILRWEDTSYARGNATITVNGINDTPIAANDIYTTSEDTPLVEPATTAYLETTFDGSTAGMGNMFDITTTSDIMITGFDVHINTSGEERIEIYYKSGTYVGSEKTPADWTLLDNVAVVGAGGSNATHVPVTHLEIPAGTTIGFYIQVTEGSYMRYNNSSQTYANGDLEIGTGASLSYNWANVNAPRNWNGRIYYKTDGVLYNDSDPDHDTLTALIESEPSNGTVALNSDGSFVYTPTQDFNGSDSFTYYTLDDAEALPAVGYWPFAEGSGSSSADESGNGLTASLLNGPTFTTTVPITPTFSNSYALAFDGSDDRVTMADSTDINDGTFSQRTVMAWFRADDVSVSSRKQIVWEEGGKTNGLNIYLYDGTLYAGIWGSPSSWITSTDVISGQWHHVAFVLDSDDGETDAINLYLDGQWQSSGAAGQLGSHTGDIGIGNQDNHTKFHTGTSNGNGGHGLAGLIDEVQVYNLALTQSQIQTLMSTDLPGLWDLATVTLNVTAVNDRPTAVNDNYAVPETVATTVSAPGVLDNDIDVDGDVITAVIDSPPANGTIALDLDGGFTYTPTGGFSGIDTFSYIVDDGALTDSGVVTLTVKNYCYTQVDSSGTVYESVDSGAVQEAVDAAQADDLIKVAGDCVGTQTYNGETQTVYISQSLTIQGGYTNTNWIAPDTALYTTTLDAEQNGRVAYIPAGVTVTLSSLTLQNGFIDANGGGVYNEGALTIEESVIQNNISDGSRGGGGVYSEAGSVTITDSDFIENDSTQWTGGAFYIIDTDFSLMNSTVMSNTALQSGAGAALWNDSPSIISGTLIADNTSTNGGGAGLFIGDVVLGVAFYDTVIENNSSAKQCGAINNQESLVILYNSTITGNSTTAGNETGIVCNLSFTSNVTATMVISKSEISNNSALYGPGLLQFVTDGVYAVEITDSVIDSNIGGGNEGVVGNFGSGTLAMTQVVVKENDESGVYNDGGTVTIVDSAIISNTGIITGAGIVNISGAISLENSTVSHNSAIGSGGGIWNDATLDMNHVTIANNSDGLYNSPADFAAQPVQSRTPNLMGIHASADEGVIDVQKTAVSPLQLVAATSSIANSIIADNSGSDCSGDVPTSGDYNLDSDDSCSFNQTNDLSATDPLLATLTQDTSMQATWVHAFYGGSPARNAIPETINGCGATHTADQRGMSRPFDGACDRGAYESHEYRLITAVDGTGGGSVSSDPSGIGCETDCSEMYADGTVVTLTAAVTTGSTFIGWTGAITTATNPITMTMDAAKSVTATFTLDTHDLTVVVDGTGGGTISSDPSGISCESDCSEAYDYGTVVTLTAANTTGSTFMGWTGAISSTNNSITLTMDAAKSVTATFTLDTHDLTVVVGGTGGGTVSSDPSGISCESDCSEAYDYGTVVTLTAAATTGSSFTGWTGACTGMSDCMVTISEAKAVTATFTLGTNALTVLADGTGTGSITGSPSICGVDCSTTFDYGTVVTLTAVSDADSTFEGWSGGGCSGTGDCVVTMTAAQTVTATFTKTQFYIYLPVILK